MSEEIREMNGLQKLVGVIFEPSKTFTSLDQRPTWILPAIILIVVAIVSSLIIGPLRMQEAIDRIEQNPRLSEEQREEIVQRMEDQKPFMKIFSYGIAPAVAVLIFLLVVSGILYFGGTVLLGGDAPFKKVLSVYSFANVVSVPAAIVKIPLMMVKKSVNVQTSLAAVLPAESEENILFKILAHFDIFTLWEIALVSMGLAVVYKFDIRKSAGMVIGLWILWVIVSVALSTLLKGRFMFG